MQKKWNWSWSENQILADMLSNEVLKLNCNTSKINCKTFIQAFKLHIYISKARAGMGSPTNKLHLIHDINSSQLGLAESGVVQLKTR